MRHFWNSWFRYFPNLERFFSPFKCPKLGVYAIPFSVLCDIGKFEVPANIFSLVRLLTQISDKPINSIYFVIIIINTYFFCTVIDSLIFKEVLHDEFNSTWAKWIILLTSTSKVYQYISPTDLPFQIDLITLKICLW